MPLVNLANILYKWGRVDDAVKVMRDAVEVSDLEVRSQIYDLEKSRCASLYYPSEVMMENWSCNMMSGPKTLRI